MSRISGRNGRVFIDVAGGGNAALLPFVAKWSINASTDQLDVTAMEDANKTYISDVPDASGDFSGYFDDATNQTYTAAVDGLSRKFYCYPDFVNTPTVYWYGYVNVDFSADGGVGQGVNFSAKWSAAGPITKKP